MVLAIVHPSCHFGSRLTCELLSVEVAHEVLCGRTSERTARIDVANEHPLVFVSAAHTQLHKVRTFPNAAVIAVFCTELAFELPRLEVVRRIDVHVLTLCENHVPFLDVLVPEHVWVAEVGRIACNYWVAFILCECLAVVCAVCQALCLVFACRRIHSHHCSVAESGSVVVVHNSRT